MSVDRGKVFLKLGEGRGKKLTAVIFSGNHELFREAGIDPNKEYKGKYVEVVGKIEKKGGLQIVLDTPSQIQVVDPQVVE